MVNQLKIKNVKYAVLGIALISISINAQIREILFSSDNCSYFGEKLPSSVATFESDSEAENVVKRIVNAVGLVPNFEIRAGGVPNAAATIRDTRRFIIYDQFFIRNLTQQTGTKWAAISVMAHEIGHHLNGHTLDGRGSRPSIELEADVFSGAVLQKMGATLDEARKGMELLGSPTASQTHPAKHDRLAAITKGWIQSCDADANCGQQDKTTSGRTTEPTTTRHPPPVVTPQTHPGCREGYEPYWLTDGRPGCRATSASTPLRSPTIPPSSGRITWRQGDPNPCPYIGTIPIEWVNGSVRCGPAR